MELGRELQYLTSSPYALSFQDTLFQGTLFTSLQVCSVTAFLNQLATSNNSAIVTPATAMIDDDGELFIAVFRQEIDFTEKMDMGLINPN